MKGSGIEVIVFAKKFFFEKVRGAGLGGAGLLARQVAG
jgi:hypothetical protein